MENQEQSFESGKTISGDLKQFGFEIIHHQYLNKHPVDYLVSVPANVLEICINVQGIALIHGGQYSKILSPEKAFLYNTFGAVLLQFRRLAGKHEFISVLYSKAWVEMVLSIHSEDPASYLPETRVFPWSPEIGEIVSICNRSPSKQEALSLPVLTQQLLVKILEQGPRYSLDSESPGSPNRIQRIDWIKAYLKNHLSAPLSLLLLAERTGCSPSHLSRTFASAEGITLSKYLQKLRLDTARRLLSENNLSITEIALEIGYQSASHFSQVFHRNHGCSPHTYRRRFR